MQQMNPGIENILGTLPLQQRRQIAAIMQGKVVKQVLCLSKTCKGRIIGQIQSDGKFMAVRDQENKIYCRASRHRLDGFMGFQCWCGNDSRLSAQEKGNAGIRLNNVTKTDIEEVFDKIQAKPSKYRTVGGRTVIDGFAIVEVA